MLAVGAVSTVGTEAARQVVIRYGIRAAMPVAEITAGTLGTVVVVSGAVGAVAGHGIDQIPTLWGGEKLSDYWGDAIAGVLDLRPDYSRPPRLQTQGAMPPPRPPSTKRAPPGFPGDEPNEHHRLPQEFREWFKARGLDIEKYTTSMPQQWHTGQGISIHSQGYNAAWRQFISQNPNATAQQALDFMSKLETSLGFGTVPPATPPPPGTVP